MYTDEYETELMSHMTVKSSERRQAIIEAAVEVFREVGFSRASMAAITTRAGGSKATLYSYFSSKEELFASAMTEAIEEHAVCLLATLDVSSSSPNQVLRCYAERYLELLSLPDVLALTRTAIAEGAQGELGRMLYDLGPKRALDALAEYLSRLRAEGYIRQTDPNVAAAHLRGLLEAGMFEPMLYGAVPEFSLDQSAQNAVDAFLRAYGTPDVR